MANRSTVEVSPVVLKVINAIARHRKLKVKTVADGLLRFAIPHEKNVFSDAGNNRRDNK